MGDGENLEKTQARPAKDKILLIRRPSNVRLNGITLDLSNKLRFLHKIYWSECNTNTIMGVHWKVYVLKQLQELILLWYFHMMLYMIVYRNTYILANTLAIYTGLMQLQLRKQTREPSREKVLSSLTGQSNMVRDESMDVA